jgi:hypothetical protein
MFNLCASVILKPTCVTQEKSDNIFNKMVIFSYWKSL